MAVVLQFRDSLRNGWLDAIETDMGASAILRWYDGTMPADESTALSGNTKLAEAALPSDEMAGASGGVKSMSGSWQDASADASGNCSFFRIYKADGTTCIMQGNVGVSAAAMIVPTVAFVAGQPINVTQFDLSAPG